MLELTGDGRGLLVRSGPGFPEGVLGGVLAVDAADLPGHALRADGPVVIADFASGALVGPSPLQRELGSPARSRRRSARATARSG